MRCRNYRLAVPILLILWYIAAADPVRAGSIRLESGSLWAGDRKFIVRGIAYSTVPIGRRPGDVPPALACLWTRDLPLVAASGANTVRTLGLLPAENSVFLELLESNRLYWLADFPLDRFYDPTRRLHESQEQILAAFRAYAERFRGQPRLIGYVLGNEVLSAYQRKFAGPAADFDDLLAGAAEVLRQVEPEGTPLLTTTVRSPAEIRDLAGLSFWSWNAAGLAGFTESLAAAKSRTHLPVLVSEFGIDAFDAQTGAENEQAAADAAMSLADTIESFEGALGGVYRSFVDEWWHSGPDSSIHSTAGGNDSSFPDGVRNDSWFGIFRPAESGIADLDSLHPRLAFRALADRWGGRVPASFDLEDGPRMARVEHAATGEETAAPGVLVRLQGKALASAESSAALLNRWPLDLGTSCLCLAGRPAPLGLVAPDAVTAQAPWDVTPGEGVAMWFRSGRAANPVMVSIRKYAPGIFADAIVRAGTACRASVENGVRPGEVLEVYATGLGAGTGSDDLEAAVNGTSAEVLYVGLLPSFVGLNQVNLRVGTATPPSSSAGLVLRIGGISGPPYPLPVAAATDRYGVSLTYSGGDVVLQAGADPRTVPVRVEGVNGYCGPVLFTALDPPQGVSFRAPTAFTGQSVPLELRASTGARPAEALSFGLGGSAAGIASGRVTIPLSVLPSRGEIPVRVISGGFPSKPIARFDWNGRTIFATTGGGPGRGINVMAVDPSTGVFAPVRTFDTWGEEGASSHLIEYLAALPPRTLLLFAVADEATYLLSQEARDTIAALFGSRAIGELGYQHSWAMISRKGDESPLSEGSSADTQVVLERVLTLPVP
jgi:uncharacterized protein (TIGR03437 family)